MSLVPFGNWPERKLCLWVLLLRNFCGNSSRWHGLRKIRHLTMMIICNPYNPVYSELNSFMVNIPILNFVKISDIQRLSFVVTGKIGYKWVNSCVLPILLPTFAEHLNGSFSVLSKSRDLTMTTSWVVFKLVWTCFVFFTNSAIPILDQISFELELHCFVKVMWS